MAKRDEFDDEGFLDSLLNRKGKAALPPGLRRVFIGIAVLGLISILIAVVFSSIPDKSDPNNPGALPLIRADKAPFRIKPEDPGGMAVPNKDSTIFETLKGTPQGETENLLEDDADTAAVKAREEVVAKVETAKIAPLVDVDPTKSNTPPDDELDNAPPQPKSVADMDLVKKPEPVAKAEPKKEASIIETLKEEGQSLEVAKPAPKAEPRPVAKTVTSGGSTYIQLASVKSEADANIQWAGFKAKNPELANLSLKVQKADLGAKGIYYRIQAGPISAENATSTCAAIKSRGGSCLIAK